MTKVENTLHNEDVWSNLQSSSELIIKINTYQQDQPEQTAPTATPRLPAKEADTDYSNRRLAWAGNSPKRQTLAEQVERRNRNLRVEIADVSGGILVALGRVLAQQVCSDSRSNSSRHLLSPSGLSPSVPNSEVVLGFGLTMRPSVRWRTVSRERRILALAGQIVDSIFYKPPDCGTRIS